jgi:nitrogen regulatory protein P-II 1
MKSIKAFIRTSRVDAVVGALEQAGAPGITVSRVHGVGYGYDPYVFTLAPHELARTPEVAKIEVVCADGAADRLVGVITEAARTGSRGDGIVFLTPVEKAVRIRTGEEGDSVLGA